jgi:hypothetical protein
MQPDRKFEDVPAVRHQVPLLVGLAGSAGSGKTKSALRLADGMREVIGGDIYCIDTEAARALHYSDYHKFRHVNFTAPFGPLDYLAAVRHCVGKGASIIIIDSTSHIWEGPGGVLEMHESECERLMQAWKSTHEKVQMSAWQRPKAELRRFINEILQLRVNLNLCFRAKEKLKLEKGKNPQPLGWMPIAPAELVYEFTLGCLLYPGCNGIPTWHSEEMGEKAVIKLPQQFASMFEKPVQLSESIGRQLAEWARGGVQPDPLDAGRAAAARGAAALQAWWETLTPKQKKAAKPTLDTELKPAAALADQGIQLPAGAPADATPEELGVQP